jgi:hypothetical protein
MRQTKQTAMTRRAMAPKSAKQTNGSALASPAARPALSALPSMVKVIELLLEGDGSPAKNRQVRSLSWLERRPKQLGAVHSDSSALARAFRVTIDYRRWLASRSRWHPLHQLATGWHSLFSLALS